MNVTKIESRTVKKYTVNIEDGEVRTKPFSRGLAYRVNRIVVTKQDGTVSGVELRGKVIKKDGTDGANPARESFHRQSDWPDWLRSIIGGLA